MNYGSFSTATLAKILDRSPEGSAEQTAVQEELRRRGENSRRTDKQTPVLFTGSEWEEAASKKTPNVQRPTPNTQS